MMDALLNLTAQMAREGIRRLLVLSGDESWTLQQAQALRERLGGDGLWVGPEPVSAPCVAPGALKTLPDEEIDSILADEGEIDMHCDYCGNHYIFNAMDIAEIRNNASPADPQLH